MYQQLLVDRILARVRYTYRCIVDVPYWQLLMTTAALYSCTIDTAVVWQQLYCMAIRILSIVWLLHVVATVLVWLQPHCNSCMTAIYGSAAVRYYGSYLLVGTQSAWPLYQIQLDLARSRSTSSQLHVQLYYSCTSIDTTSTRNTYLVWLLVCTCTVYCTFYKVLVAVDI